MKWLMVQYIDPPIKDFAIAKQLSRRYDVAIGPLRDIGNRALLSGLIACSA